MEALFIWISLSKLVKILKNIQVFNELGDANQVKKLMPLSHMNRFIKIVKMRSVYTVNQQSATSSVMYMNLPLEQFLPEKPGLQLQRPVTGSQTEFWSQSQVLLHPSPNQPSGQSVTENHSQVLTCHTVTWYYLVIFLSSSF